MKKRKHSISSTNDTTHSEVLLHLKVGKQKYPDSGNLACEEARKTAYQYGEDCRKDSLDWQWGSPPQFMFKSSATFSSVMINCEDLVRAGGQVVCRLINVFEILANSMLSFNSFEDLEKRLNFYKSLTKIYSSLKAFYEQYVVYGFKILPDIFGV